MRECLGCLGEGHHDLRDMDANMLEHFTRDELLAYGYAIDRPSIIECDVCAGTGEIDDELWKDMMAQARAAVDQIIAKVAAEER